MRISSWTAAGITAMALGGLSGCTIKPPAPTPPVTTPEKVVQRPLVGNLRFEQGPDGSDVIKLKHLHTQQIFTLSGPPETLKAVKDKFYPYVKNAVIAIDIEIHPALAAKVGEDNLIPIESVNQVRQLPATGRPRPWN